MTRKAAVVRYDWNSQEGMRSAHYAKWNMGGQG